jgi:putative ABC transport system permease protein
MPMKVEVGRELARQFPGARAVAISWRYLKWQREPEDLMVQVAAVDAGAYYAANAERGSAVPNLPLFRRLAEEPGTALVSDNFAGLYHVAAGDVVTLRGPDGPIPLRVLGSVEDYVAPRGLILVQRDHYPEALNAGLVDVYDVYLPAGTDPAAARDEVAQSPLQAQHALVPLTGAQVRQHVLDVVRRIYSVAYLQEIAVGVVAALGVAAALMISVIQRRRELGLLRAVGATRSQVLRAVLFEALLMGLIGSALGVLFGVLLEWYAVRVVLLEESGFRFPVTLPWRDAALIAALAVTAATLAGLLPSLRAVRLRIADAIAYE